MHKLIWKVRNNENVNANIWPVHGVNGKSNMTKARRNHKCTLCGEKIHRGENYIRETITPWTSGNESDDFYTFKAHEKCNRFWSIDYGANDDWQFPEHRDFYEALQEAKRSGQFPFLQE